MSTNSRTFYGNFERKLVLRQGHLNPDTEDMKLSETLKKILQDRDISIGTLAKECDVPKTTIATWLKSPDSVPNDLSQVQRICRFLGVSLEHLLVGADPMKRLMDEMEQRIFRGRFEVIIKKIPDGTRE